jgi:hypothetical protein
MNSLHERWMGMKYEEQIKNEIEKITVRKTIPKVTITKELFGSHNSLFCI